MSLQKERVETLKQALQYVTTMYEQGQVEFKATGEAQLDLLEAQLEAADSTAEQMTILKAQLDTAENLLKLAKGRFDAGVATQLDMLQAKALQLRIKVRLLKLRRLMQDRDIR